VTRGGPDGGEKDGPKLLGTASAGAAIQTNNSQADTATALRDLALAVKDLARMAVSRKSSLKLARGHTPTGVLSLKPRRPPAAIAARRDGKIAEAHKSFAV
jgi:hypothetical protein